MVAAMLTDDGLARLPGVRHGFFTRRGGVSTGIYASLNCSPGSGDDPAAVSENRARAMRALGLPAEALRTLAQRHSARAVRIGGPAGAGGTEGDALVTVEPGRALGVLTADCAAVLLADPAAGVIGAAHAGWRGARAGVLAETVAAMEALGAIPARIVAAVGPCIGQPSYEVGPEFPALFAAEDADNRRWFTAPDPAGRSRFDLAGYVAARLAALGLTAVSTVGIDSFAAPARFFSYRRSRLLDDPDYGRALSCIALAP